MAVTEQSVLTALKAVKDPQADKDIVALGLVRDLAIRDAEVSFTLAFSGQSAGTKAMLHSMASRIVGQLPGVSKVNVKMGGGAPAPHAHGHAHADAAAGQTRPADLIPGVRHTIAVSSGKGGV